MLSLEHRLHTLLKNRKKKTAVRLGEGGSNLGGGGNNRKRESIFSLKLLYWPILQLEFALFLFKALFPLIKPSFLKR